MPNFEDRLLLSLAARIDLRKLIDFLNVKKILDIVFGVFYTVINLR
jgi:hypothetical protein